MKQGSRDAHVPKICVRWLSPYTVHGYVPIYSRWSQNELPKTPVPLHSTSALRCRLWCQVDESSGTWVTFGPALVGLPLSSRPTQKANSKDEPTSHPVGSGEAWMAYVPGQSLHPRGRLQVTCCPLLSCFCFRRSGRKAKPLCLSFVPQPNRLITAHVLMHTEARRRLICIKLRRLQHVPWHQGRVRQSLQRRVLRLIAVVDATG